MHLYVLSILSSNNQHTHLEPHSNALLKMLIICKPHDLNVHIIYNKWTGCFWSQYKMLELVFKALNDLGLTIWKIASFPTNPPGCYDQGVGDSWPFCCPWKLVGIGSGERVFNYGLPQRCSWHRCYLVFLRCWRSTFLSRTLAPQVYLQDLP